MKKAVIFDMDGVIFDSERLYMECCREAAEIFGVEDIDSTVYACIGLTTEKNHELYRNKYGEDFPLDDFWREATGRFAKKAKGGLLPVKKGARELLEMLYREGIPAVLASSTKTETVIRELIAADLFGYFKSIIGGDMVTKSKPEPDIFLLAAKRAGFAPEECIIIEDSFNGIRAARAAGGYVIMVPDLKQPDEEISSLADDIKQSLDDVRELFLTKKFFSE